MKIGFKNQKQKKRVCRMQIQLRSDPIYSSSLYVYMKIE